MTNYNNVYTDAIQLAYCVFMCGFFFLFFYQLGAQTMSKLIINKEPVEIFDLVNQLNNEQIVELLGCIFYNRPTEVFVGMYPKGILRSVEIDKEIPVCLNGTLIQINTEHSFTEEPIDWKENDND